MFTVHGGSIGRAVNNDWALPDPERHISGKHAVVKYKDGEKKIVVTPTSQ